MRHGLHDQSRIRSHVVEPWPWWTQWQQNPRPTVPSAVVSFVKRNHMGPEMTTMTMYENSATMIHTSNPPCKVNSTASRKPHAEKTANKDASSTTNNFSILYVEGQSQQTAQPRVRNCAKKTARQMGYAHGRARSCEGRPHSAHTQARPGTRTRRPGCSSSWLVLAAPAEHCSACIVGLSQHG